ncbi:MAG: Gfo/Idh/MocA family oxidoreductase [Armatimonadetes bacterium]|nr:Gfo/Idh/MocA family oxidoreductase [Armatimonadota bacterium]
MKSSKQDNGVGITRRDFLKSSAAAVLTAGVAGSVLAENASVATSPSNAEPIKAGIIGTGSQGTLLLGHAVAVPGVQMVATCDIYPPHLEKSKVVAKGAEGYDDYRRLLDRKDIQAVIIATPLYLHAPITIAALKAGKHVFCEKMMAYSIDQAKDMARTSRDEKKILQLGHQRRVNENYGRAFDAITKENVLGRITQVRAQWHRNGSWRRDIPDAKYEKLLNWRMYKEFSHGLMAELGSHQMDIANWFLQSPPTSVMASGGIDYWKDGRTTYDNISVIYEYPNGVRCTYTSITTNAYDSYSEEFMGDEGTLIIQPEKALLYPEAKAPDIVWAPLAAKDTSKGKEAIILDAQATRKEEAQAAGESLTGANKAKKSDYYVELVEFFDSVRTGKQPKCNRDTALQACVASIKANEAAEKGTKVAITPDMFVY